MTLGKNIWDKVVLLLGTWGTNCKHNNLNHWAFGDNMKEPYRMYLGTPNSQKIASLMPPSSPPLCPLSLKRKETWPLVYISHTR